MMKFLTSDLNLFQPREYALCKQFCGVVFESQDIFTYLSKIAYAIQYQIYNRAFKFSTSGTTNALLEFYFNEIEFFT